MTDVFISYASEDRERARQLANCFEERGLSVWWDRKIIAGQTYDQAIEEALRETKAVVVLWSKHSIASEWVKNEATVGVERDVLVPALIDHVPLPLEFRRRQAAHLVDWEGDPAHEGFQALCDGIAAKASPTERVAPRQSVPPSRPGFRWDYRWTLGIIAVIALGLGLSGNWRRSHTASPPVASRGAQLPLVDSGTQPPTANETKSSADPADAVVGNYHGDVQSDAKGSSQSDVTLTITKVDHRRVKVTSDYARLAPVEVNLSRSGNTISNASGGTLLSLDLDKNPPRLDFNPGDVAYVGEKQ